MRSANAKALPVPAPAASPADTAAIARGELPRLDLLYTFEAAARSLSFTLAASELFLTQSAVSRQIQQLEEDLGVPLFHRRHRSLALTDAGFVMQRAVQDCLERLRDAKSRVRPQAAHRQVSVTVTPGFASFWLIPRLAKFTSRHPEVDVRISATLDVLDLERAHIDLAVRFCPVRSDLGAPLFEETLLPVCAPALARSKSHPLKVPGDLARHTLLAVDGPQGMALTADWEPWLQVMGLSELRMKNSLRFTQYADAVAAAVAGQGVAIGRLPLLNTLMKEGKLVAPFQGGAASRRAYYVELSPRASANPDAQGLAGWLKAEAEMAQRTEYAR